jgi:hypothetical protein
MKSPLTKPPLVCLVHDLPLFRIDRNFHCDTLDFMKSILQIFLFATAVTIWTSSASAQTNSSTTSSAPATTEKQAPSSDKHIKPILDALKLNDATREGEVRNVLSEFFTAHTAWHEANDAKLKELWDNFNQARSKQDKAAADKALADIGGIYATFKPQHDQMISGLAAVLTPGQIETIEDVLTVKKVEVTYSVYLEIFPMLTDEQKAVVMKNLQSARAEAVDAGSMTEKSAFFKKYKIKIEEDYLTAQGYDPKQARKDFAAKQKADAAKKTDATDAAQ